MNPLFSTMDRRASLAMTAAGSRSVCGSGPELEARNDESLSSSGVSAWIHDS